jgi:hypothetical protein
MEEWQLKQLQEDINEVSMYVECMVNIYEKWRAELESEGKTLDELKNTVRSTRADANRLRKYAKPYCHTYHKPFDSIPSHKYTTPHPELAQARLEGARVIERQVREISKLVVQERARLAELEGEA